ncbi:MAG: hypothetical protein V1831_02325 [Candidatus Woesearchaeota archaeon]
MLVSILSSLLAVVNPREFPLNPPSVSNNPARKYRFISLDEFLILLGILTKELFEPFMIFMYSVKK